MNVSIELIKYINKAIAVGYDVNDLFFELLAMVQRDDYYIRSIAVLDEKLLTEDEADKLYDYLLEEIDKTTIFELRNSFYESVTQRSKN